MYSRSLNLCKSAYAAILFTYAYSPLTYAVPHGLKVYDDRLPAAELNLKDVGGQVHALEHYRGKVVVVNFWATWCIPCKKEMPSLQQLDHEFSTQGVVVLGVAVNDSVDEVREYQARSPLLSFPLLPDRSQRVFGAWPVVAVPTTYLIDKRGRIASRVVGDYNWQGDVMTLLIQGLIDE